MPHDRNGTKLEKGDRVLIPVRELKTFLVEPNPEFPGESPRSFWKPSGAVIPVEAEIVELWEREEACNANYKIDGALFHATFNTRLVEKLDPAEVAPE